MTANPKQLSTAAERHREKMKTALISLLCLLAITGCEREQKEVVVESGKFMGSLSSRKEWVRDQKKNNPVGFAADYGWLTEAKKIGAKEATQIGYLFFYSSGALCGYLDNPRLVGGVWQLDTHPGLPPSTGLPVFVDSRTGVVWQTGQPKIDVLALIRASDSGE